MDRRNKELETKKTREPITLKKKGDKQTTTGTGKKPIINLSNDQRDNSLKAQRENLPDTFLGKAAKGFTSPKLTGFLATTLATLGLGSLVSGGAAAAGTAARTGAGAGARGVITRTITRLSNPAAKITGRSMTTQRAFIGKSATNSKLLKVFKNPQIRNINSRYASTPKSNVLTTGFFIKLGLTLGAASLLKDAIGTYPFAGFLKQEAVQVTGFGFNNALQNNDIEGMESATIQIREIVDAERTIIDSIPYANVQKQVKQYFEAARTTLEIQEKVIADLREAGGETAFQKSQEEARQRKLEQRAVDAEYFRLIREGKFEEAQALLDQELKGGE